jgi:putative PIN family toxin of toxin-antitoxin system
MIRVVIDTNVVISAALKPKGIEAALVAAALGGLLEWCASSEILDEYEDVLRRDKFPFTRRWINQHLIDIRRAVKLVRPSHVVKQSPDEADNRFLECAETVRADFLVTGNTRHFPQEWKATIILRPRAFIGLWQRDSEVGRQ